MPEQQLVEIAKALGADARAIVMDEPTASLTDREVENLFRIIRDLKARGVGIIYISHRLDELPQIADRVTALRDGSLVGTRPMTETTRAELIRMMVGRELAAVFPKVEAAVGKCRPGNTEPRCAGRPASTPFHSASAPARSSDWPGWSAPGAPNWPACSSA